MLLAVPAITFTALSISMVFKSAIFWRAISSTCFLVTLPIISLPLIPEALARFAARFKSTEEGGVLIIKENVLSSYTLITTGRINPSLALVCSLNCLQNCIIFTPCWPKAGQTGGAGFACAPGTCSLICAVTFLAILYFFYLPVFQFHGRGPAKNRNADLDLALFRMNFVDRAVK